MRRGWWGRAGAPRLAEGDGECGRREARIHRQLRVVGHLVGVRVRVRVRVGVRLRVRVRVR
eukprot:scaffold125776_cov21-Phaeocystis_antarctica.AAC.1